jgi:uncharacterized membrane protein
VAPEVQLVKQLLFETKVSQSMRTPWGITSWIWLGMAGFPIGCPVRKAKVRMIVLILQMMVVVVVVVLIADGWIRWFIGRSEFFFPLFFPPPFFGLLFGSILLGQSFPLIMDYLRWRGGMFADYVYGYEL